MKTWFRHQEAAEPTGLASSAPAGQFKALGLAERACCCPARPVVTAAMPPTATRPHWVDLLLCGHHYRVSQAALAAAGAVIYDAGGGRLTPGASGHGTHLRSAAHAAAPAGTRESTAPRAAAPDEGSRS